MRIKNKFSPWFDRDLAALLHLKNCIWQKAQHMLTGYRSGKWEISALRLSGRPKVVTLRSSSLSVALTPRSSAKRLKTLRINPPPHSCPCPSMLMMWLLLTRSTWLGSLITTSLSQDSYLTQECLLARPTFPNLPSLLMQLSPMPLPLFPLPRYKVSPCRQSLNPRC